MTSVFREELYIGGAWVPPDSAKPKMSRYQRWLCWMSRTLSAIWTRGSDLVMMMVSQARDFAAEAMRSALGSAAYSRCGANGMVWSTATRA